MEAVINVDVSSDCFYFPGSPIEEESLLLLLYDEEALLLPLLGWFFQETEITPSVSTVKRPVLVSSPGFIFNVSLTHNWSKSSKNKQ